jgi:hypothetical protein
MHRSASRQYVSVYGPHTPTSLGADFSLPYVDAKALVIYGEASFINRATAIRLKTLQLPKVRDLSCRMSLAVIEANAAGQKFAIAIVAEWKANHEAIEVAWPRRAEA